LEAMALLPHQGSRADEARNFPAHSYIGRHESKRTLEALTHAGHPVGHDQSMAQASRFAVCQRSVGKHPLSPSRGYGTGPGYGSVALGNRLVRTRMPGGVGAGGEIPPATRLCKLLLFR